MTEKHFEKTDKQKEAGNELVISFLALRNLIGISGMMLPIVLSIFTPKGELDKIMEFSISEYYYTKNGDLFVVLLSVIGVFLLTYKGYNYFWERTLTFIAGISGIGVAFFPTETEKGNSLSIHFERTDVPKLFNELQWHFVFAALFFISLALISLIYFKKSNKDERVVLEIRSKKQKARRNMIYKIAGWTMLGCVALLIIFFLIQKSNGEFLKGVPVVFILETIAVEAFGVSWLTKGQTFYPDGEHYLKTGLNEVKDMIQQKTPG